MPFSHNNRIINQYLTSKGKYISHFFYQMIRNFLLFFWSKYFLFFNYLVIWKQMRENWSRPGVKSRNSLKIPRQYSFLSISLPLFSARHRRGAHQVCDDVSLHWMFYHCSTLISTINKYHFNLKWFPNKGIFTFKILKFKTKYNFQILFCVHDNLIIQPLKRKLLYNIIMVWREGFIQFIHVTKSLDQSISGMRGGFPVQTFNWIPIFAHFLAFLGLSTTWKVQTFGILHKDPFP